MGRPGALDGSTDRRQIEGSAIRSGLACADATTWNGSGKAERQFRRQGVCRLFSKDRRAGPTSAQVGENETGYRTALADVPPHAGADGILADFQLLAHAGNADRLPQLRSNFGYLA